jgi:phenylacetate-CoA ligase
MGFLDTTYAKLPVWAQHGAVSLYGLYWYWYRFGPGFAACVEEYRDRSRWHAEDWRSWQKQQLKDLLRSAATHVPYYHRTWSNEHKTAAAAGRLEELPLLGKEPLRENPRDFLHKNIHPLSTKTCYTSGSTGTPIASIWLTKEMRRAMAVREARSARWAGVSFRHPRATFSGRLAEPDPNSTGPFYRFNWIEGQVYFSPYHLKPENAEKYVWALKRHRTRWLTGYAVSYYLLAKFMLEQKIAPPPTLKAVVTTSEKLTPEMRQVMQEAYRCRVYEEYSTVENVLFACECEQGRLHASPDVGVIEILRPDGTPCEPGEVGEVVATCLMRTYQPLIRYRVGDAACWDAEPCPCGRDMPVIKEVTGRIEDVVIGPDGRQLVRFHGIFVNQPHVREGQIIQESLDWIRVKVVATHGFGADDEHDIIARVQQRLGAGVRVTVEQVAEIPRTKTGKFQAVINNMHKTRLASSEVQDTGVVNV